MICSEYITVAHILTENSMVQSFGSSGRDDRHIIRLCKLYFHSDHLQNQLCPHCQHSDRYLCGSPLCTRFVIEVLTFYMIYTYDTVLGLINTYE